MVRQANNFGDWWTKHPEVHKYVEPVPGTKKWVILNCKCKNYTQKNKKGKWLTNGKTETIRYKAIMCIDPKSKYAGNIYNNDSYAELQLKFTALAIIGRTMHAIAFTAYNIFGGGIAKAIVDGVRNHKTISWVAKKALESIADIFRFPFYNALLGASALVASLGGFCYKPLYHHVRAFTGDTQLKLFRGKRTDLSASPCMYRMVNITFFEGRKQDKHSDTAYKDRHNRVLVGLNNLARDNNY